MKKGERKASSAMLSDTWRIVRSIQEQLAVLIAWHPDDADHRLGHASEQLTRFAEGLQVSEAELKPDMAQGSAVPGDAERQSPRREDV